MTIKEPFDYLSSTFEFDGPITDLSINLEFDSPITEEQWDMIMDVDFDNTEEITFHTKHGKEVTFVKKHDNGKE